MAIMLDEEDEKMEINEKDLEYLYKNYDKLVQEHNEEYVAIKDERVVIYDKDLNELKKKLENEGLNPSDTMVRFIKDRRNEIH